MKQILFPLFCLLLSTACSKSELSTPTTDDREVRFNATLPGSVTRVSGTAWSANDKIGAYATSGSTIKNKNIPYITQNGGAPALFTKVSKYLHFPPEGNARFYAYYPYSDSFNDVISVNPLSTADQTDWLVAVADNNGAGYTDSSDDIPLAFTHLMARITIKLSRSTDGTNFNPLSDQAVYCRNLAYSYQYTVVGGTSNVQFDESNNSRQLIERTSPEEDYYSAMVAPRTDTARPVSVDVTYEGRKYGGILTTELKAGHHYIYEMKITDKSVTITSGNPNDFPTWGDASQEEDL